MHSMDERSLSWADFNKLSLMIEALHGIDPLDMFIAATYLS